MGQTGLTVEQAEFHVRCNVKVIVVFLGFLFVLRCCKHEFTGSIVSSNISLCLLRYQHISCDRDSRIQ